LRALLAIIDEARSEEARENAPAIDTGWRP